MKDDTKAFGLSNQMVLPFNRMMTTFRRKIRDSVLNILTFRCLLGVPGWLIWLSVQLLTWAEVVGLIPTLHGFDPHIRLCTGSVEPDWDSLSLPLSLPLPHSCALSLSQNKL